MPEPDYQDLASRVQQLEANRARVDTLWEMRLRRDESDAKQFTEITKSLNQIITNLKVMQARMTLSATVGGAIAAMVFQMCVRMLDGGS